MSLLRTLLARLRSLLGQSRHEDDLDDELRAYVDALTEQHERRGLSPEAARRAALLEAGGTEQVKERVRDVRVGFTLLTAVRDARHGCRVLWQSPGCALVVILDDRLGDRHQRHDLQRHPCGALAIAALPRRRPDRRGSRRRTRSVCRARTLAFARPRPATGGEPTTDIAAVEVAATRKVTATRTASRSAA